MHKLIPDFSDIFPAPPDVIAEKTWIHAAEGCDIQLACTLHGDVNSEVSWIAKTFWACLKFEMSENSQN